MIVLLVYAAWLGGGFWLIVHNIREKNELAYERAAKAAATAAEENTAAIRENARLAAQTAHATDETDRFNAAVEARAREIVAEVVGPQVGPAAVAVVDAAGAVTGEEM